MSSRFKDAQALAELVAEREIALEECLKHGNLPKQLIKSRRELVRQAHLDSQKDPLVKYLVQEARKVVRSKNTRDREIADSPLGYLKDMIRTLDLGVEVSPDMFKTMGLNAEERKEFEKRWKRFSKSWSNLMKGKKHKKVKSKALGHLAFLIAFCEAYFSLYNLTKLEEYGFTEVPNQSKNTH